ncbi:cutinase family protein [Skermania sp. ID1734]|nr:cutinase family protein [Skermania sp. ID1734]
MVRRPGRRSRRTLRNVVLLLLLAIVVIVAVILLIIYLISGRVPSPIPVPPPKPPATQPASCPDVELLAIPGTWESSPTDDPHNPTANPNALLLNVTRPLQQQFPPQRVDVYTVPYVAQFSNPVAFPPDGQQSYNVSRKQGTDRATAELTRMHHDCPLSTYVIVGFSQGAVIAGDIAAQIGQGNGPVPADEVLGVTLIADGRREPGQGNAVGPSPPGVGAEVALKGLSLLGITMTGPRPGGFGDLASKVYNICAPGDMICAAPQDALNPLNIPGSLAKLVASAGNPVHAQYNSFVVDQSGTTATQWTAHWAAQLISAAPHPAHS